MTAQIERRTTTMDDPYVIANPALTFLNLAGEAGNELMARDYAALEFVFNGNIQIANRNLPRCNVLFLYGALDASGRLAGNSFTFRDVIKGAGAHIAVLASELPPDLLSHPEFMKGLPGQRRLAGQHRDHAAPQRRTFRPVFHQLSRSCWRGPACRWPGSSSPRRSASSGPTSP